MRLLYPSVLHMYRKKRASRESNSVNVIKKNSSQNSRTLSRSAVRLCQQVKKLINNNNKQLRRYIIINY